MLPRRRRPGLICHREVDVRRMSSFHRKTTRLLRVDCDCRAGLVGSAYQKSQKRPWNGFVRCIRSLIRLGTWTLTSEPRAQCYEEEVSMRKRNSVLLTGARLVARIRSIHGQDVAG